MPTRITTAMLDQVVGLSSRKAGAVLGVDPTAVSRARKRLGYEQQGAHPNQGALSAERLASVSDLSTRAAAEVLGVHHTSVQNARYGYIKADDESDKPMPKILTLDIETKPNLVYSYDYFKAFIPIEFEVEPGHMMTFASKWFGTNDTYFAAEWGDGGRERMVEECWDQLTECDILVTYNGERFDSKKMNNEFIEFGLGPAAQYHSIDLFKTNKTRFDFPSKKLDYIAQRLGLGEKTKHSGGQLWLDCINGDADARALMEKYNRNDVVLTEKLYKMLQPWLVGVPHMGMWTKTANCCPYCGGTDIRLYGEKEAHAFVQSYLLYRCYECKGWSKSTARTKSPIQTRPVR